MSGSHRRERFAATPRAALTGAAVVAAAAMLVCTPGALATTAAPATVTAPGATADDGARVVSEKWLDDRTVDLKIDSPAAKAEMPVRLLLPRGWSKDATRTWPVLYLLQGAHDDYTSWTRETDIEEFTADKDVITVLPSAGPTGIVTDWWNNGPNYEKFQVDELWQILRGGYRAGDKRVVAGISTGGYGAVALAARRPGSFAAAASYSGILSTLDPGLPQLISLLVQRENLPGDSLWGNVVFNWSNWQAHNPFALASKLRGTPLYISQGSGVSMEGDPLDAKVIESTLWIQAHTFALRLATLGVPVTTHFYLGAAHAWNYWQREFKASWPMLAKGLGVPA
ncbi:alpha/beta hydrolase-fold protein [Streptomyces sp. B1866]|uniref:alpha/beta hydrolase n=1 Tax=Streptomyces sp. B1866 TaxID=3075431 RepID=UPI00288D6B86|nr:alpha/beta hydrolase-fold protein [Streptomyces sp. B1866]MDT3396040.1 alpha/beta hydrolase-fold protein [Streptomyces sp. B1866]